MWTVSILSAAIVSGMLRINFEFTNGTDTFTEFYDTRAGQPLSWLNRIIYERLEDLNTLENLIPNIPLGPYTPNAPPVDPPDEARDEYREKLALYYRMTRMVDVGVILANNAEYTALKLWLKNNFIPSYNTLFISVNDL